MDIPKQIEIVREEFRAIQSKTKATRNELESKIEELAKLSAQYTESWAGEWFSTSYNIYFAGFDPTSSQKVRVKEADIKIDIKRRSGIDLDQLRLAIPAISKLFFSLQEFILSELAFINDFELYNNQRELYKQIEEFQWGMPPGAFIKSHRPTHAYVTDPTILNSGIDNPPHLEVGEEIIFTYSLLHSYDNFEKLVHRLLRQLEIKSSSLESSISQVPQQELGNILDKFHIVATQLKNRYSNRSSIVVKDEYDVQDILNALLRINFEDIRKEEYTPSYAGGSTRVDFLLKREKIIIEVKKTRDGLKDKEVGTQLIVDIARYKSHPDCKHLICFVYDPENLIVNPRGLEDDLNKLGDDDMLVEVFIRP